MARKYPFSQYSLIVASGHSPLSFVFRLWSPQCSILIGLRRAGPKTQAIRQQALLSHGLDSRWSRSGLQRWAMGAKRSAWMAAQSCRIGRFNGSDKLRRSFRDNKLRAIFIVGLEISLSTDPISSMAPAYARGTRQSAKL